MKSKKNLLHQLVLMPHFNKSDVFHLGTQMGLKKSTINTYVSRFLKSREIFQLKRSVYVSSNFFNKNKDDISYLFYLANISRTPSYVTSWSALQYYNLATESIRSIISVTPNITRSYKTKAGSFLYHSIKKNLFTDFSLVERKFCFFIASPAKALFDLLYFKTNQFRNIDYKMIYNLIKELRIDIDEMSREDREKFDTIIKNYIHERAN